MLRRTALGRLVALAGGAASLGAVASTAAPRPAPARPKPRTPPKRSAKAAPTAAPYGATEAIRRFAEEVAARRDLPEAWIVQALAGAEKQASVQRLIMPPPPGVAKNWNAYRDRFVEPRRIGAGVAFWEANAAALARAEERHGVPAEIVVGIVGVETFYGRIMGSFRVVDALATLSFDFPSGRSDRTPFFRGELEEYLVFCRREDIAPGSLRGSFAGAIGLPQFMPGSINRWALDFDGNGHVDLVGSPADAIGSVAHYLQEHGWRRGMPTHHEVLAVPEALEDRAVLLAPDIYPSFSAQQMLARGLRMPEAAQAHEGPLALVELENGENGPRTHVLGTQNFYAITRYNWSSYYALAVIALGDAVRRARG